MNNLIIIFLVLVIIISFAPACDKDASTDEAIEEVAVEEVTKEEVVEEKEEAKEEEEAEKEETPAVEADLNADYIIKFEATWSSSSHPDDYVSTAHFSPFVAYSYNGTDQGRIFTVGSVSTPGVEEMAETGATDILEEEINQIIEANNALSYVKGKRIDSPGQTEATLEFTQEFSHFIFVSMIAPSPDWFVTEEADLFVDGQWVDQIVLDVISYDAGTDSGDSLTAANSDTDPKQPITLFDDSLQELGTITITKS
jgi:hypothetical protein